MSKDDDCHFSGQPVLMLDRSFCDSILPDIQTKSSLAQRESIASDPITCDWQLLIETTLQAVVESNELSPQPPLLQAKHAVCSVAPHLLLFSGLSPALLVFSKQVWASEYPCSELSQAKYRIGGVVLPRGQGTVTSLSLLATLFLIHVRMPLVYLVPWTHSWLLFSWLLTCNPRYS